jgi:dinuclear metal center YbgI/SA1388 family protein
MHTLATVVDHLKHFAPLDLAEEWDNVGLLLGDPAAEVGAIMSCLTVTPASAAEAVADGANLIVSHHPILYKAVQRLTTGTPEGRMLLALLRAGVAVYSPHTAFDNCTGGINDLLCERLGLTNVRPLKAAAGPDQCKLVAFVPESDLSKVSDALFSARAGVIGNYEQCSFRLAGTGTFFGTEAADPTVGQKGRREEVAEWRLEVVCPASQVPAAVAAMRKAHSYEEPAFDVYPLKALPRGAGSGRVGELAQPESAEAFGRRVAKALRLETVQLVGAGRRDAVRRVAVVCGAGGSLLGDVRRAEADGFLTGEMRFHDQLAAEAAGVVTVLAGHYATERPGVEMLAERLQKAFPTTRVWASRREADPAREVRS